MIKTSSNIHVRTFAGTKGKTLFVYLLNKSGEEKKLNLTLEKTRLNPLVKSGKWLGRVRNTNPVFQEKKINNQASFMLNPTSITVAIFKVK